MKRNAFLATGAAVALAGCGGRLHSAATIPAVSPNAGMRNDESMPAPPIPQNVLSAPILGEMRRFDGAAAPAGWVFAQGQTLQIVQNRALFGILGRSAGGDGKTTFNLPKPRHAQFIIAVVGIIPRNPTALAALRPGRAESFGVSVPGLAVRPTPGYGPVPKPVIPDGHPLWAPGTVPTAELIRAQETAAQEPAPTSVKVYGRSHAP